MEILLSCNREPKKKYKFKAIIFNEDLLGGIFFDEFEMRLEFEIQPCLRFPVRNFMQIFKFLKLSSGKMMNFNLN